MIVPIRVVTVAGDAEREATVAAALSERGDVDLLLRCVDRAELLGAIRSGSIDAIVSIGAPAWFDRETVEEAGSVRIVGITDRGDETQLLMRLGATVMKSSATTDEIVATCRSAPVERLPSSQPTTPRGKLIAVWGPKGAPGRTVVSILLAASLARDERDTLLIDGDAYGGDILQYLAVVEELPTIVWASRMAAKEELDAARLTRDLRRAGSGGPVILPGLVRAELWPEISDFGWRQLLDVARAVFRFTICDIGFCLEPDDRPYASAEGRNRIARKTAGAADRVVAVCDARPLGLKNFLWSFDQLRDLVDLDDILVVANKVPSGREREVADVLRRHINKRPIAYLPPLRDAVVKALDQGLPLTNGRVDPNLSASLAPLRAALGVHVAPRGILTRFTGAR